jgi:hypothetical protein
MPPITVLVVLSSAHEVLFRRYFRPTVPPGLRLEMHDMGANQGDGAYLSEEWQEAMCAKVRHALDFCRRSADGVPFIVSDVDVQFFPAFDATTFLQVIDSTGCDLVFQRERFREGDREANCGFYAGRNSAAVRDLLAASLDNLEGDPIKHEQNAINRMMRETGFRYAMFDRRFYARTHGFPPPRDLWTHHATWTSDIAGKIAQLERVRRIIRGGAIRMHAESLSEHLSRVRSGKGSFGGFVDALRMYTASLPLKPGCLP